MSKIVLVSEINSTPEVCFDLSTNIDLHLISASQTMEEAIGGRTSGHIGLGETVTWRATHFGIRQNLTAKITAFKRPYYFKDEQIKGAFKKLSHEHFFEKVNGKVIMTDILEFETPYGLFGKLFERLILTNYLKRFLATRNHIIKEFAERHENGE